MTPGAWLLILILMLPGHSETSQFVFATREACHTAAEQLRANPTVKNNAVTACVARG